MGGADECWECSRVTRIPPTCQCIVGSHSVTQVVDVIGCPGFDVVESDDLKPLQAESTDKSCGHAGGRFDDVERSVSETVFRPVSGSPRSEVGISRIGRLGGGRTQRRLASGRP